MDTAKYQGLFKSEAAEILRSLDNLLVQLEKTPSSKDVLNEIFRMAHTLKGMAATMNYSAIVQLSHEMENMLDALRANPSSVDQETCAVLFKKFDALSRSVAQPDPYAERRMVRINDEDRIVIAKAALEGTGTYITKIVLHKDCAMVEARSLVILKTLQDAGKILNEDYVHNQIKNAHFGKSFIVFFMTKGDIGDIKKEIKSIQDVEFVEFELMPAEPVKGTAGVQNSPDIASPLQGIRVSVDQLDSIVNLVGELVINKTQLETVAESAANADFSDRLSVTHSLMSELQMEVMNVRLFPMSTICDHFPRMVRDLAKSAGKQVNLEIFGAEIGLDRVILDEIKDPLVHILRNCVDHGIEFPDIRRQKGKDTSGLIKIQARKERGRVSIEVTDDGNGMDIQRIKTKAVSMGLITNEEALRLGDQEAAMLITAPGLSTAEQVTHISGRGVGMDIVKKKVELVGGSFLIETRPSIGTKIILSLPVSMTVLKGLMVQVHHQIYAIPVANILKIVYGKSGSIKTIDRKKVLVDQEQNIPLLCLRDEFGLKGDELLSEEGPCGNIPIVVVEANNKAVGLMVDGLVNQQDMIVKALDRSLAKVKGIGGATILGSGKVALIIDVRTLI
jgi:two-component system chemotaxis sensor kinase CheA